jgi:membrane protease subunit HflC
MIIDGSRFGKRQMLFVDPQGIPITPGRIRQTIPPERGSRSHKQTTRKGIVIAALAIIAIAAVYRCFFTVDETQYAIVTLFGGRADHRPGRACKSNGPGKASDFREEAAHHNPKPSEFLTRDKKNVVVDNYVCWRIADPNRFLQTVNDTTGAEMRLHDTVWSAAAAALGATDLSALVSVHPEELKLTELMRQVTEQCRARAAQQYGIEVVDVRLKRIKMK